MSGYWRESDVSSADEDEEDFGASGSAENFIPPWLRKHAARPDASSELKPHTLFSGSGNKKNKSEWLSGSWPLRPFDESLPTNKRKSEWLRFRNQFERIVSCKSPVDAVTRLTGLKIYAGSYLLSIIEMLEKRISSRSANDPEDVYKVIISALDKYFNEMCDTSKERMKFREMKMRSDEAFADWVLRLESQAQFCEFTEEQSKEELVQALLRRSIPEIAGKLYELSDIFENSVDKIISHGKHLDYIRKEASESGAGSTQQHVAVQPKEVSQESEWKPVNALHSRKLAFKQSRFAERFSPYDSKPKTDGAGHSRSRSDGFGGRDYGTRRCKCCGRQHEPGECKAFRVRCFRCNRVGHYAQFCESSPRRSKTDQFKDIKKEAGRINQMIAGCPNPSRIDPVSDIDPRLVECMIGCEQLTFLVDTGATVNTITRQGWQMIKRNCHTVIQDLTVHPEEVLRGYANQRPLDVVCSFQAYIAVKGHDQLMVLAKFFVVNGTKLSLLGYSTSHKLNLIRIGHPSLRDEKVNSIVKSVATQSYSYDSPHIAIVGCNEFPKLSVGGVRFKVDGSVIPKQIIRYNVPRAFEDAINKRLADMEEKGIIERADKVDDKITFVSPMVLVPKGTKDFRIVIDYREVNKAIIREPYPMPSLEKIWADIPHNNGSMFFSKLDLKDAYFHVELHEDVRHVTTFMTANGLMRFKRLPFGLSCAPELFQRVMERILINCKGIIVYLDDVLVFAPSVEELQNNVDEVKSVLVSHNLTINEEKSSYNQRTVEFVGFTLDGSGILPTQKKISDIMRFEKPKDSAEVRSFLGMLTFISPFIQNFSHMTKPLRDLLNRTTKFEWTEERQKAFDDLKSATENDLVKRGYFKGDDRTILYTDASPWGLGAVLTQEDSSSGERRIIACASKSLTDVESRYPQLHREALAIVWAMERFSYYLLGRKFTLRSDSEALMFMVKAKQRKDVGKRIMSRAEGWFLRMDHFNYVFEHVSGKDNIADAASRIGGRRNDMQFGVEKEPHELCLVDASINNINEQLLALTTEEVLSFLSKLSTS